MNQPSSELWLPPEATVYALEKYSFSDEAAQLAMGRRNDTKLMNVDSIKKVWEGAHEKNSHGIMPFENSNGGVVWPHLDGLRKGNWSIGAEVHLKVRMNAGALTGLNLEDVQRIYSHPKGLEQCTRYVQTFEGAKPVACDSTVDAARRIIDTNDVNGIALASRSAIEELGLKIVGTDVADTPGDENITQFFIIHQNGTEKLPNPEALHHAAIITPDNVPGALNNITSVIKNAGVDLHSIHSRPIGSKQYAFFVEMGRNDATPSEFSNMARWFEVSRSIRDIKWLGSWDNRYEN